MKLYFRFLLIFLFAASISSCHEKEYDIIDEARKLFTVTPEYNGNDKEVLEEKEIISEIEKKEKNIKSEKIEKKEDLQKADLKNTQLEKKAQKKSRIIKKIETKKETTEKSINTIKKKAEDQLTNFKEHNIKIGIMLPLSGENQEIGNLILNALEMAMFQTKVNKLELIIKDTQANPKTTRELFNELLDQKVKFIIGPLFSKTLGAIQPLVNQNEVSVFALTNNKNLAKKGVWTFGVDPQEQTIRLFNLLLEKGYEKTAVLLPQNAYGLLLFETISNFSKDYLYEVNRIEFFENNIESQQNAARKLAKGFDKYNKYLLNLKEKEKEIEIFNAEEYEQVTEVEKPFDSVFIAASGQALTILASQLQYNYVNPKQIQFFGTPSWEDESILNEPALEGGLFTATSQVYQKTISKIYKKSFKKNMPKVAMIAYDIVALLGTLDFEKDNFFEVKNLINEEGYLGLRGLFRLTENGFVERTFDVKQIKNNRFIIHEAAKNNF